MSLTINPSASRRLQQQQRLITWLIRIVLALIACALAAIGLLASTTIAAVRERWR